MCKYTIYRYECGDPAEDNVETKDCTEFQRTGVHCDRDNPANKDRVQVRAKTRNGICVRCLKISHESNEIAAMEREIEKAKEESRREAKQREEEMQRAERRIRQESLADFERRKAALAAETAKIERASKEKYDQEMRQKEQEHLDFMLRKSVEEAELKRQRDEQEELQKALIESLKFGDSPIEYQDEAITTTKKDLGGGTTAEWQWTKTEKTAITKSDTAAVLARSSMPPAPTKVPAMIPAPPPLPPLPASKTPTVKNVHPPQRQEPPQPRVWNLPAVGDQHIGHLKIGNRSQPIHPSQQLQPAKPSTSASPAAPAHEGRLRGVIAPDLPALRQAQGQIPTVESKAGLRRTSGTRWTSGPPPSEQNVDPQLQKLLEKRRKWEDEGEEDRSSDVSVTPSQSASNVGTQASTPASSVTKRSGVLMPAPMMVTEDSEDAEALQARRLNMHDFDNQRRAGWSGDLKG